MLTIFFISCRENSQRSRHEILDETNIVGNATRDRLKEIESPQGRSRPPVDLTKFNFVGFDLFE